MAIDRPLDQARTVLANERRQTNPVMGHVTRFASFCKQISEALVHAKTGDAGEAVMKAAEGLKGLSDVFAAENSAYLLDVVVEELAWLAENVDRLSVSHREFLDRDWLSLLVDADRKARQTRSQQRVRRLADVLVNAALTDPSPKAEFVEEMLRIAMDLDDIDVCVLAGAVRVQEQLISRTKRPSLHESIQAWKNATFKGIGDGSIALATEKLQSLALLERLETPSNINSLTPLADAYLLTQRGLAFVRFLKRPPIVRDATE